MSGRATLVGFAEEGFAVAQQLGDVHGPARALAREFAAVPRWRLVCSVGHSSIFGPHVAGVALERREIAGACRVVCTVRPKGGGEGKRVHFAA